MNIIKILIGCLLVLILALGGYVFLENHKSHEANQQRKAEFQQKTVLAVDTRKALSHLMLDLLEARKDTILDAPADGQWHNRIAFTHAQEGAMEYLIKDGHLWRVNKGRSLLIADNIGDFRIRRQKDTPDILEVQVTAQNNVSLISNLKIRIRQ